MLINARKKIIYVYMPLVIVLCPLRNVYPHAKIIDNDKICKTSILFINNYQLLIRLDV